MTDWHYRYRIGDFSFSLTGRDPDLEALASGLYRGARVPGPPDGQLFQLRHEPAGYALVHRDATLCRAADRPDFFQAAEWALTEACLAGLGSFLQLHAGVVALGGRGWLLAGPPESGKTSLVLGLFAAGAAVLTDEVALLDPATLHLTPFPRDLIVRRGTERLLAGILPGPVPLVKRLPEHCYLCPADLGPLATGPVPVSLLVFPCLAPHRSPGRRRLGQAEAARRLLDQALNLDRWGGRGIEAVAALVEHCPAVEVAFADGRIAARSLLAAGA